jgi:hypothetical protein
MLLDFLSTLRKIKAASLANSLTVVEKSNHNYKLDEYKVFLIQLSIIKYFGYLTIYKE